MSKTLFVIINILFFVFNFVIIRYLPAVIVGGILPSHFLFFFGTAPIGSIIWYIYYKKFFATQKDL